MKSFPSRALGILPAAGAFAVLASRPALANSSTIVDFHKCFSQAGPAPYLITMTGPTTGDVPGALSASVLDVVAVGSGVFIEADSFVTAADPSQSFVARVGGRLNGNTRRAVLYGYVSEGALLGAHVLDEFENNVEGTCSTGTLRITPKWDTSHGGNTAW